MSPLVNIHRCLVQGHEAEIPLRPAWENTNFQNNCKAKNLMYGHTEGRRDGRTGCRLNHA